jgi:hypothetical protein
MFCIITTELSTLAKRPMSTTCQAASRHPNGWKVHLSANHAKRCLPISCCTCHEIHQRKRDVSPSLADASRVRPHHAPRCCVRAGLLSVMPHQPPSRRDRRADESMLQIHVKPIYRLGSSSERRKMCTVYQLRRRVEAPQRALVRSLTKGNRIPITYSRSCSSRCLC